MDNIDLFKNGKFSIKKFKEHNDDEDIVCFAMSLDEAPNDLFKYVSDRLKNDDYFILKLLEDGKRNFVPGKFVPNASFKMFDYIPKRFKKNLEFMKEVAKVNPGIIWVEAIKLLRDIDNSYFHLNERKEKLMTVSSKYMAYVNMLKDVDEYMALNLLKRINLVKDGLNRDFEYKVRRGEYLYNEDIDAFNQGIASLNSLELDKADRKVVVRICEGIIDSAIELYDFDIANEAPSRKEEVALEKEEVISYMKMRLDEAMSLYEFNIGSCEDYKDYLGKYLVFNFGSENATDFLVDVLSESKHNDLLTKDEFENQRHECCGKCENGNCKCLKKVK